jgi:protein-L-isoaspartate O-methyltransferase
VLLAPFVVAAPAPVPDRAAERAAMVLEIENLAATAVYVEVRRIDRSVLTAMRAVPRHLFVPQAVRASPIAASRCPSGTPRPSPSPSSSRR